MNNTIKVLLATYNGEKYIKEQIDSILNQKNVEVDVVVGDDKSRDNTVNFISENYPLIPVSLNNPGTGSAANNFLKMVSELDFAENFDFVAFSDQDDIWLPEKMSEATEMLQNSNAELYCSNLTKWDTSNNTYSELKKDFPQRKFDYLFEGGSAGCTYVFTKKFAQKLNVFIKDVDSQGWKEFSHDWLIYFFARSRDLRVVFDNNSFINYRIHSENVHGHLNKISFRTIIEKSKLVLNGYYQSNARNLSKYLPVDSEGYKIYKYFLGNYLKRNYIIWKYNTELMRDRKKFFIFALLNLIKF